MEPKTRSLIDKINNSKPSLDLSHSQGVYTGLWQQVDAVLYTPEVLTIDEVATQADIFIFNHAGVEMGPPLGMHYTPQPAHTFFFEKKTFRCHGLLWTNGAVASTLSDEKESLLLWVKKETADLFGYKY